MKHSLLLLAACLVIAAGCTASPKEQVAVNPLTYTDIPDPDIIRVGEDYYMVSTTMYFCPGAPIMHSRDLVHWEIVNYIYDVIEDDDIYNLRNGRNAYGKGQWATTLRYHDGTYYALFVANDQQKTYMYRTKDIVNGPWERNVIEGYFMHDASLLFDDGRLWVVWGNGNLNLVELEPDGSAVKAGAEAELLIESPREGWNLRAEGAHFYHIGDYYYVLEIDWPRDKPRTATVWRSKDIHGPYESKVVLQGTLGGRGDGIAQGPIVETQFGDWYAVQFQDHGAVGRIPCLQPVTWVDGWPIMGENGVPLEEVTVNLPPQGRDYVWDNDEFDSAKLALVWQWNHKAPEGWSLTERPGWLRLRAAQATGLADARGTLTQRTVQRGLPGRHRDEARRRGGSRRVPERQRPRRRACRCGRPAVHRRAPERPCLLPRRGRKAGLRDHRRRPRRHPAGGRRPVDAHQLRLHPAGGRRGGRHRHLQLVHRRKGMDHRRLQTSYALHAGLLHRLPERPLPLQHPRRGGHGGLRLVPSVDLLVSARYLTYYISIIYTKLPGTSAPGSFP